MKIVIGRSTKIIAILTIILVVGFLVVFFVARLRSDTEKLKIIATNFPAYDFARAVAGDKAEIKMLLKPGLESHTYDPTPQDIIDIEKSDLLIYNGGESDEWVDNLLANLDTVKVRTFKMMDEVELFEEDDEDGYDEHVWTSVRNAAKIVKKLEDILISISSHDSEEFSDNAAKYVRELNRLDQEFDEVVKNGNRKTLVFADRFPFKYFVNDYGLTYLAAFPGCAEQTEADVKTVFALMDKVKIEKIPIVMKIELSSGELANMVAKDTGALVKEFYALHNVSADDFKNGVTYVEMMQKNVETLREALK